MCPRIPLVRLQTLCSVDGCSMMKTVLNRVETHTKACPISNLPGGQDDCTTCNKWQSMIKLREHYRRKLINYIRNVYPNAEGTTAVAQHPQGSMQAEKHREHKIH